VNSIRRTLYGAELRTTQPKPLNKVVDFCHAARGQQRSAILNSERTQAVDHDQACIQGRTRDDDRPVPRPYSDWENQTEVSKESSHGLTCSQGKKQ